MTNPTLTEKDVAESADWRGALVATFARPGVLDAMQRGLSSGGFPMIDGVMVNWSDWLIHRIELEASVRNHLISTPDMPKGGEQ